MKRFVLVAALLVITTSVCRTGEQPTTRATSVRQPAVAGRFYSDDATELLDTIESFVRDAEPPCQGAPIAIIAPHAGYIFSGGIAADAYRQASDHTYDVIVILGTNHTTARFPKVSIYDGDAYRTPLGDAAIDTDIVAALMAADDDFVYDVRVHRHEHSVEVQVPFIQHLFPGVKIVSTVIGAPDLDLCARFGHALAKALEGKRALIVASSDFSHYPSYDDAVYVDGRVLEAITTFDPGHVQATIRNEMGRGIAGLTTCACGQAPILCVMTAAKALGATRAEIVSYANSGDASAGDRGRVVGYGAVRFTRGECGGALQHGHKRLLLSIARDAITGHLSSGKTPEVGDLDPELSVKRGVFVTLTNQGKLRGCIGHMKNDLPLHEVVRRMAIQAATNDRRFPPVTLLELPRIEIEISVLTPYQEVESPDDIALGRDGILIRKGGRSAVYLPQVATEQGWDLEETLQHLCRKAGLRTDGWKSGATFFTFQSEVFSEAELR